jgi:hypothetical protein
MSGDHGCGLKMLEKIKPKIKVAGFKDIDFIESATSLTLQRQIINKLQIELAAFDDHAEIWCQIPYETYKSINVVMTTGL